MKIHRTLGGVLILVIGLAFVASGREITMKVARDLVREALVVLGQDAPSVSIVPFRYDYAPEFLSFEALWPNPGGSTLIGYFGVNPWTGDVWEINGCYRITSAKMKKMQISIWKESQLIPAAERTLHEKTPGCSAKPAPAVLKPAR
jgi:hypothetical protein